ncbi:HNH endonuclease signature motif containing protein [Achromobacter xylosoxidans]|uniref:HNH endonuclease signature motif containing protein n=1 Tax=Achromobacter denitrificans TaxID=32002 RepID=A0ABZ3GAK2_ACHDE|nr:HNH endonuclease signature motif containing protein [Achromobacter xylosoxidans]MDZ5615014.1 HNH endonuclease signature motif containing protein [Achromobacter xylosoxidans]MDZ5625782.1 HNH endonuclease signature motif containing protein [Achromobacter xylosoxidans]MDZ5685349.1 HNH endonuclease signature motif containing protein [Achromobacter xylosoxidans]
MNKGRAKAGELAGCRRSDGYWMLKVNGQQVYLHRAVFAHANGYWPDCEVDHIDQNKDNNSPENLRAATHAQNGQNKALQSNNTSGCAGVGWMKADRRWRARIKVCGKEKTVGYFETLADAIAARELAVRDNYTHAPRA